MLRKLAAFKVLSAHRVPNNASARALKKAAHRVDFDYTPRPGFLYVRSRMISSRCNDNFDEFPAEEIKKAYATFIGKPVFVNHHNDNADRARGVVIDAALHEDRNPDGSPDTWVEGLMEVDARKFPKLAKAILAGHIDRTSMGCDVELSVCSACGNKATNPAEYCQHIPAMKGLRIFRVNASTGRREGHLVRETCYGLKFFENSLLVEEPADPTAAFTGVDDRGLKVAARRRVARQRKQAIEDEEIWKGLDLPTSEQGHEQEKHQQAKDLADKLMGPLYDEHGGRENFLLNRDNKNMTDLQHRYEGGPGTFAFDEEGSGEPYYEIKHHDAQGRDTGWRARHYADGPNAEIHHAATPGEAHDMLDLGDWTSEGHQLPVHFDHHDLAKALSDWHSGRTGDTREYMEGQYGDPRIRRWKRRHLAARTALNEVKAPPDVDTLRAEECPVCGDSQVYDGQRCPVCGFIAPPHMFRDPDLQVAQQTDLRQDQAQGDNLLPGQMDPNQPGGGLIDPAQMGSGSDAANQLFHPDQLNPDGVPGYPGDGVPDLMCPVCGFQVDAQAPETVDTQDQAGGTLTDAQPQPGGGMLPMQPPQDMPGAPDLAPADEEQPQPGQQPGVGPGIPQIASEGDVCPNCGQATLLVVGDTAGGPDQDPNALADPNALPEDGQEDVPPGDEANPAAGSPEDDTAAPDAGNGIGEDDQDEDQDTDDAVSEEDEPTKDRKDKNPFGKGANRMSKAVEAAVAVHNDLLDGLRKENAVLKAQLTYLARLAGVEPQFAQIRRQADVNNPASPVPDPPEEQAYETTEQALGPEAMDNAQQPGQTPGSVNRVPAEQSTTPLQPGETMPTMPANQLVDVTAPVAGTNTGEVPLEQRRIETDVRIDPDPLKAQGPGVGGQGNTGAAFPWVISSKQEGREVAAMHLAKLRKSAGLAQGDEMTVTAELLGSDMPKELMEYEIKTLSGVQKAAGRQRPAGSTRRTAAARTAPSLAPEPTPQQLQTVAAGGMDDVVDADLFM